MMNLTQTQKTPDGLARPSVAHRSASRAKRSPLRPAVRHGLTLVELMVGLSISAVVLAGLATFTAAIGQAWKQTESAAAAQATAGRSSLRIDDLLRPAEAVLQATNATAPGESSYFFYWRADDFGGVADGIAQAAEMELIEFNPTNQTLWQHRVVPASAMSPAQVAAAAMSSWSNLRDVSSVTSFKALEITTAVPLAGMGTSTTGGSRSQVVGVEFSTFIPEGGSQIVAYKMAIVRDGAVEARASSVTLRSPRLPSNVTGI